MSPTKRAAAGNNSKITSLDQVSEGLAELSAKVLVKKTQREIDIENMLDAVATLGGRLTAEEDIEFKGTKLILPETMELVEAIKFLGEKLEEDEKTVRFTRVFNYRAWDGAHATMVCLKRLFGAMTQRSIMTMFGEEPPELRTINIGPHETMQVPWGRLGIIHLPKLSLYLNTTVVAEEGRVFTIVAEGPRKYRHHVEGIFRAIEEELKTNSIYRGKAFDGQQNPVFLDVAGHDPSKVVYSDETMEQLEANIWAVLRYPNEMEQLGIPLKRAVLLEGPYGTGKSLAAMTTAQIAVQNGWSFLMCRPGRDDLMEVMQTAKLYQPAVVFFEDIDCITGAEQHIPQLLDVFDGIRSKDTRIMCVLTTNFVERLHKAMMRPGRLDAVIHIGELDTNGLRRLIESIVPVELLAEGQDWDAIGQSMDGFLPAFAKEAIDRTMRYNIARNEGKTSQLMTEDFVSAAVGLRRQLELMEDAKDTVPVDTFGSVMKHIVDLSVQERAPLVVTQTMQGAHLRDNDGDITHTVDMRK